MPGSFRIGKIAGIDIDINGSWIIILVLLTVFLATGWFPQLYPGWSIATYWVTGFISSLLLFVSVLLHELAHAVSQAGVLGMLGIGSTESVDFLVQESAIARGTDQMRFGIGLHAWAIEKRPDLLDAAIEAAPFLISISFGSAAPYAERLHLRGIVLATQVNTRAEAVRAERSGVDLIRAQGTEAGDTSAAR